MDLLPAIAKSLLSDSNVILAPVLIYFMWQHIKLFNKFILLQEKSVKTMQMVHDVIAKCSGQ